ncbi:hypothetical protein ACFPVT_03910 [Corynebacterium choanae]|nr:hypothetical protein [Corynebacterium choanae]
MSQAREFFEQSGVMGNTLEMLVRLAIVIVQPLMLVAATTTSGLWQPPTTGGSRLCVAT